MKLQLLLLIQVNSLSCSCIVKIYLEVNYVMTKKLFRKEEKKRK